MKTLAIAGTFDTKGREFLYVKKLAESLGLSTLTIDTGVFAHEFPTDITPKEVAQAAGYDIEAIVAAGDRAQATAALTEGMAALLPRLYAEGRFGGVLSLGGSGGTAIVTAGMRELPLGVPKIMVSTMASGDVARYVGVSDIVMMPAIVDVSGLNTISRTVYRNAVNAAYGMLEGAAPEEETVEEKPLIAATMFGVTTPCITAAQKYLEERGYEVLVFHATGTGGRTMEALISSGYFAGVLDITTTEWCDEVVGGILAAGLERCTAAGLASVPHVVSVGALDMVNFAAPDTVPARFEGRTFYRHNPQVTLMRTSPEELRIIGKKIADNLNRTATPSVMLLPLRGVSMLDVEGGAFWDEQADSALFETLRSQLDPAKVRLEEREEHINDESFAHAAAQKLIDLIEESAKLQEESAKL